MAWNFEKGLRGRFRIRRVYGRQEPISFSSPAIERFDAGVWDRSKNSEEGQFFHNANSIIRKNAGIKCLSMIKLQI